MQYIHIILLKIGLFANNFANLYNQNMILNAREIIKLVLSKEGLTQKQLTEILNEKTGKKYTQDGISKKLTRGTIPYNEVVKILDVLGYELNVRPKSEE